MPHHRCIFSLYSGPLPSADTPPGYLDHCQTGFRLLGRLSEWIPFSQHQISMASICALMPKNPLDVILQSIPHQYRRQLLDLPQELLRVDTAFKFIGMEDGGRYQLGGKYTLGI